jgi:hypothetical protein
MGSYYIAKAGLRLLGSKDPPPSASPVVGNVGIYHLPQLRRNTFQ